jgi:hypothetical protein
VSGCIVEDIAEAVTQRGTEDYSMKDRLSRLGTVAKHAVEESKLLRWREVMIDRECRWVALEAELDAMCARLGEYPRHRKRDVP